MYPIMTQFCSLYIHWPFCKSKCPYCDFNSHVRESIDYKAWLKAYYQELDYFAEYLENKTITSIFFGGGTPSLMPAKLVESVIDKASKLANFASDIEITLEANPTSIEVAHFKEISKAGVNRLSLGIQSFNESDLKFLGREHSGAEALNALDIARKCFNRYSFDLIYARPNQTTIAWQKELEYALSLVGDHISLYQLTIEKGTAFYSMYKAKQFTIPDEDLAAELYEITNDITSSCGLYSYEVSNYAKPGGECKHNLTYWHYDDYLGIGPGAHSRIRDPKHRAIMMLHSPEKWLETVMISGVGIQNNNTLDRDNIISEILITNLRLNEGLNNEKLKAHTGLGIHEAFNDQKLKLFINKGLLLLEGNHLKLTKKGRLLLNKIVEELC
jgi:putative oxygen-independent coproporphyrinogen III oxidase